MIKLVRTVLNYDEFVSYLINKDISQNISAFEFLEKFKLSMDNNLSYYNYLNVIERYFSLKEIEEYELYDLYCLSFKINNGRPVFNEYTNETFINVIANKFF